MLDFRLLEIEFVSNYPANREGSVAGCTTFLDSAVPMWWLWCMNLCGQPYGILVVCKNITHIVILHQVTSNLIRHDFADPQNLWNLQFSQYPLQNNGSGLLFEVRKAPSSVELSGWVQLPGPYPSDCRLPWLSCMHYPANTFLLGAFLC